MTGVAFYSPFKLIGIPASFKHKCVIVCLNESGFAARNRGQNSIVRNACVCCNCRLSAVGFKNISDRLCGVVRKRKACYVYDADLVISTRVDYSDFFIGNFPDDGKHCRPRAAVGINRNGIFSRKNADSLYVVNMLVCDRRSGDFIGADTDLGKTAFKLLSAYSAVNQELCFSAADQNSISFAAAAKRSYDWFVVHYIPAF